MSENNGDFNILSHLTILYGPPQSTLDQLRLIMRTFGALPHWQMQLMKIDGELAGLTPPDPAELRPLEIR